MKIGPLFESFLALVPADERGMSFMMAEAFLKGFGRMDVPAWKVRGAVNEIYGDMLRLIEEAERTEDAGRDGNTEAERSSGAQDAGRSQG